MHNRQEFDLQSIDILYVPGVFLLLSGKEYLKGEKPMVSIAALAKELGISESECLETCKKLGIVPRDIWMVVDLKTGIPIHGIPSDDESQWNPEQQSQE